AAFGAGGRIPYRGELPGMDVGLLGGTFNPIHHGHLRLAEEARESFGLAQVWFIPNPSPPHRSRGRELVDAERRFRMVELATRDHPCFVVSRCELDRPGVAYTVDTLETLRQEHPGHRFSFLTGADSLLKNRWRELDRLLGLLHRFVAARRPGFSWGRLLHHLQGQGLRNLDRVARLDMPACDVSGTLIRERRRAGRSIRYLLPEPVRLYIEEHRLYAGAGD
ncbi:MAG: nicotinate-nucleotide adenylyltransferase, partial [Candidatus Eremiobacterota bacterium]